MNASWQAAVAAVIMLALPGPIRARADEPATFVGAQACAGCHTVQFDAWKGSHHALAMQKATEATGARRLRRRKARAFRGHDHLLPQRRQVHGPHRRPGRRAARLSDRLHVRCLSAAAIFDRISGRAAIRHSASPGTAGQKTRAASAGSTSTPASSSNPAIRCTGPGATRPGTTSAPTATPPI